MKKKAMWAAIFFIMSGIFYEIDKALNCYKWASYIIAIQGNGSFNSRPDSVLIQENFFCWGCLMIAIVLVVLAFYDYCRNRAYR